MGQWEKGNKDVEIRCVASASNISSLSPSHQSHNHHNYECIWRTKRQQPSWYLLVVCLLSLILLLPDAVLGQQSATFHIPLDTTNRSLSLRQNICDRAQKYDVDVMSDLELRHALEGLQLNVAVSLSNYFMYQNGTINAEYPGLMAVLMDELAKRGRFTWRDSFAVYDGPGDKSWTEMLLFMTNYFDLSVEWWVETVDRLKLGVSFPQGWYDASFILVTAKKDDTIPEKKVNMWGWLLPFEADVWILIIFTLLWSGVVYMFLEYLAFPRQYTGKRGRESFGNDIFLSLLLFTQHFQFTPKTPASRIHATSMAFWALLISSAYTANLASFFVDESKQDNIITSIEDAIRMGKSICVWDTSAHAVAVQKAYPTASYVKLKKEKDLYISLNNGVCAVAVTTVTSFQDFSRMKETNEDCRLYWTGSIFRSSMAGFATKADAGIKCTSLIHDILNLHILEMEADGFIQKAWEEHFFRHQDHSCGESDQGIEQQSQRRSIQEMGGTFVFHFSVSVFAVLLAVVTKLWKVYKKRLSLTTHRKSVTQSELTCEALDVLGPLPNGNPGAFPQPDINKSSSSVAPARTLLQDFWAETPSARMRSESMRWASSPEASFRGLNNVQLVEMLQDELQQQQEQIEKRIRGQLADMMDEKLGQQQDQFEQRIHDQINTMLEQKMQKQSDQLQHQFSTMMNFLRDSQIGMQGGKPIGNQKELSMPIRGQRQSTLSNAVTASATESKDTQSHLDDSNQSHKARLRLKAHQIPQLLYPHDQKELKGALAQHFGTVGIDFPEEANVLSVRLRKVKSADKDNQNEGEEEISVHPMEVHPIQSTSKSRRQVATLSNEAAEQDNNGFIT